MKHARDAPLFLVIVAAAMVVTRFCIVSMGLTDTKAMYGYDR